MTKHLRVTFSDGSTWKIPIDTILESYKRYYSIDVEWNILKEELAEWASSDMDWEDVRRVAEMISPPCFLDYDEEWVDCKKEVVSE